jgi:hypothetical protein
MNAHGVAHLLMGGQACILYGAAEFSRDADLAILAEPDNMRRLKAALDELNASIIAVPPFEQEYLDRGHAVHFRCRREDVNGLRVDVMARMRGVDPFQALWERRTTVQLDGDGPPAVQVDVLSLPDLIAAKKTQRDKDWPMIRRLVEANYFAFRDQPNPERAQFWLAELRTPELLVEAVARFRDEAATMATPRGAVAAATAPPPDAGSPGSRIEAIRAALEDEQRVEQARDREYWQPLRSELERLRRATRAE